MQASINGTIDETFQRFNSVSKKAKEWFEEAQKPGREQKISQAALRSIVGIIAISQYPYTASLGAAAGIFYPSVVKNFCHLSEGAITGIWNRMTFNQKVFITSTGVISALYFDPTAAFGALGTILALKLGAELGLKNLHREEIAEKYREIEQNEVE